MAIRYLDQEAQPKKRRIRYVDESSFIEKAGEALIGSGRKAEAGAIPAPMLPPLRPPVVPEPAAPKPPAAQKTEPPKQPKTAADFYRSGLTAFESGDSATAAQMASESLRMDKNFKEAANLISRIRGSEKPAAKPGADAMAAFQKSVEAFKAGDRKSALAAAQAALSADPGMAEASAMIQRLSRNPEAGSTPLRTPESDASLLGRERAPAGGAAAIAAKAVRMALPPIPKNFDEARKAVMAPVDPNAIASATGAALMPESAKDAAGKEAVRAAKGYGAGIGGMVEGAGGAVRWLSGDKAGKGLSEYGKKMQQFYSVPDPKFRDAVYAGVGSLSTFIIPSLGISKATQAISAAPKLASWLGVGASSVMEALVESGANYERGLEKFKDKEEASKAATKTFWLNLPTLVFTNKFGLFGENGPAVLKWLKSATGEAVQEWTQQIFGNVAVKDPALQGAGTSAAVGFLTGGGAKAVESLSDALAAPTKEGAGPASPGARLAGGGLAVVPPSTEEGAASKAISAPKTGLDFAELMRDLEQMRAEMDAPVAEPPKREDSDVALPETKTEQSPRRRIPRAAIEARVDALVEGAGIERGAETPLEQFVRENGGIRSNSDKKEEFGSVPIHLRGNKPADEMRQMAIEQGIPNVPDDLEYWAGTLKKRGKIPSRASFYEQARRELEHEYETYGPPSSRERGPDIPDEPIPFERGQDYGGKSQQDLFRYTDLPLFNKPAQEMAKQAQDLPPAKIEQATPESPAEPPASKQSAGAGSIQDFGEKIGGARKDRARPLGPRSERVDDGAPGWSRKYSVLQNKKDGKWSVYVVDGRGSSRLIVSHGIGSFGSEGEAKAALPLIEVARKHRVDQNRETGKYDIVRQVREKRRGVTIKGGFESRDAAMEYMAKNPEEIIAVKFKFPERPWLDNIERTGPDRRDGNVTPKMFQDTFGFRGGEFGNWNMGGDGQAALNHAYDALLDLAEFIDVDPKALSLDGDLAIAFGARGTGGKESVAAHFEPDYGVINLTKIKGAGSLAHEWFHALDYYLGRGDRGLEPKRMASGKYETVGTSLSSGFRYQSQTREALKKAFKNLMDTIEWKTETVGISPEQVGNARSATAERAQYTLNNIRRSLDGSDVQYTRTKKSATAAQMEKWRALEERLMRGDPGEQISIAPSGPARSGYRPSRSSFRVLEDMNVLFKEVTGRSFDSNDPNSSGRSLYWLSMRLRDMNARMQKAEAGEKEAVRRHTDYYKESVDIDGFRASDYWSIPTEMGARAFESFIFDKATGKVRKSQYLVYGVENKYYAASGMKPYPEGQERLAINTAFQNLFDTIEQVQTEKGVALREPAVDYAAMPAVQQLDLFRSTGEGVHQVRVDVPKALQESVVVKELQTVGYLDAHALKIEAPEDTAAIFSFMQNSDVESFYVVGLDSQNRILGASLTGIGALNSVSVRQREIFKNLQAMGASKAVIVHNHPSHDPTPSPDDIRLTERMNDLAKQTGVQLVHHAVINDKAFSVITPTGRTERRSFKNVGSKSQKIPVVQTRQSWQAGVPGAALHTPEAVGEFLKNIQQPTRGVVAVVLNTKNQATAVWQLASELPKDPFEISRALSRIAMRNAGYGVILTSNNAVVPGSPYMASIKEDMRLLDVKVFDWVGSPENDGKVFSAMKSGLMESQSEYGAKEDPGSYVDDPYIENRKLTAKRDSFMQYTIDDILKSAKDVIEGILTPISTELKNIDPSLKIAIRRNVFNEKKNVHDDLHAALPLIRKASRMSREDQADLDLAGKNGDVAKIGGIVARNGLQAEYAAYRKAMDALRDRAIASGVDMGYLQQYFPRIIQDRAGFLEDMRADVRWPEIASLISRAEAKGPISDDDKIAIINNYLRGYQHGRINIRVPGNVKAREIPIISAWQNQRFLDWRQAVIRYIEGMNKMVADRIFFGKSSQMRDRDGDLFGTAPKELDVEKSIGVYVKDAVESGRVKKLDEGKLKSILDAYFNQRMPSLAVKIYRDITTAQLLGNYIAAITQIQDLDKAITRAPAQTAKALFKAIFDRSQVKLADIGLDQIAEEFSTRTRLSRFVAFVFRASGLTYLDRVTAETPMNAILEKYRAQARKSPDSLRARLEPVFGIGWTKIIDDLKAGRMTDDIRFLAFSTILDIQPKALTELPRGFLRGGNARLFYMVKTFQIRQLDYIRNEALAKIAEPGAKNKVAGIVRLGTLVLAMAAMGMGTDAIKDWLLGRKTSLTDRVLDNILKVAGFSKWTIYKARQEGIGSATMKMILPPAPLLDQAWKDVRNFLDDKRTKTGERLKLESAQSVPLVGKHYYWRYGRGKQKVEEKEAADRGKSAKSVRRSYARRSTVARSRPRKVVYK